MEKQILNSDIFMEWKNIDLENWQGIVSDIIKEFMASGVAQYQTLEAAQREKNLDKIRRAAHSLKSSCGNIGAEKAHHLLDQIETLAEVKNLERVEECLAELEEVFAQTVKQLVRYQESNQAVA